MPLPQVLGRKGCRAWRLGDTDWLKDGQHRAGWRKAGGPATESNMKAGPAEGAIMMPTRDRDSKGQHGGSEVHRAAPWAAWRTIVVS